MLQMNDCSSSNIYEGYCQIKKSTGNTVKNGADRLRADDCHPREFEQTLVSENFHFPISNFQFYQTVPGMKMLQKM